MDWKLGGLIVGCLFASAVTAAPAPSTKVVGIRLHDAFLLSECATMGRYPMYQSVFAMSNTPCWMHKFPLKPGGNIGPLEEIDLAFSSDVLPRGVRVDGMTGLMAGGRLESISMLTNGLDVQDSLLAQLEEKYGPPSRQGTVPVQNRMGATFASIDAEWRFDDLTVRFTGLASRVDRGLISFVTPAGKEAQAMFDTAERAAEPSF